MKISLDTLAGKSLVEPSLIAERLPINALIIAIEGMKERDVLTSEGWKRIRERISRLTEEDW